MNLPARRVLVLLSQLHLKNSNDIMAVKILVIEDHTDYEWNTGLFDYDPLIITGKLESPGETDTFSIKGRSGDKFVISANYLLRGAITTAVGHPKLILYGNSPSEPFAIDDRAGSISYDADDGVLFLDVSSYNSKLTSDYQIIIDRIS